MILGKSVRVKNGPHPTDHQNIIVAVATPQLNIIFSHYICSKAMSVAERIDAGTCFINTYNKTDVAAPFGGFKMSGFGKDMGQEALNEYLKTKTIIMEYSH